SASGTRIWLAGPNWRKSERNWSRPNRIARRLAEFRRRRHAVAGPRLRTTISGKETGHEPEVETQIRKVDDCIGFHFCKLTNSCWSIDPGSTDWKSEPAVRC